jgi:hypothetical protein
LPPAHGRRRRAEASLCLTDHGFGFHPSCAVALS